MCTATFRHVPCITRISLSFCELRTASTMKIFSSDQVSSCLVTMLRIILCIVVSTLTSHAQQTGITGIDGTTLTAATADTAAITGTAATTGTVATTGTGTTANTDLATLMNNFVKAQAKTLPSSIPIQKPSISTGMSGIGALGLFSGNDLLRDMTMANMLLKPQSAPFGQRSRRGMMNPLTAALAMQGSDMMRNAMLYRALGRGNTGLLGTMVLTGGELGFGDSLLGNLLFLGGTGMGSSGMPNSMSNPMGSSINKVMGRYMGRPQSNPMPGRNTFGSLMPLMFMDGF